MSKFLYFAYGSNLLKQRIHLNNPSAVQKGIGKVEGYRLDFNYFSQRWKGAAATIVEDKQADVWGVIWELDQEHQETLDRQEGVSNGIYRPLTVTAVTPDGSSCSCRSYQLVTPPETDRRPSAVYHDVIVRGAVESGLPGDYVERLRAIENNGYSGRVEVELNLSEK